MKFRFIILSFLLIAFSSCEKDKNDDYSTLIIGKWEARAFTYVVTNEKGERISSLEDDRNYDDYEIRPFIRFKSDGTGVSQDYDVDGSTTPPVLFKWSIKADELTLEFEKDDDEGKYEDFDPEVFMFKMTIVNDVLKIMSENIYENDEVSYKGVLTSVFHRAK